MSRIRIHECDGCGQRERTHSCTLKRKSVEWRSKKSAVDVQIVEL